MKKYISIDNNVPMQLLGMLVALLIPIFGAWWNGTRFTSMYSDARALGGLWVVACVLLHICLSLMIVMRI
jgi:hypothetical protein